MHELSMDLNAVLRHVAESGASDVRFKVGQPAVLRFDGRVTRVFPPPFSIAESCSAWRSRP